MPKPTTGVENVRRDLLTLLQNHVSVPDEGWPKQLIAAQLNMLGLIEDLDRKISMLAAQQKNPAG